MVGGKWLTAQLWDLYIKKNHPHSDSSLVYAVMFHHAVSYDPTLRHVELHGRVNGKGVYHHFMTGNNKFTLHFYQARQKGEDMNGHKFNTGFFGRSASTIPLPISLASNWNLKTVMTKVIPNMVGTQTPTSKKATMMVIRKWPIMMYKLLIFLVMMRRKALCPRVKSRMLCPNYFIFRHFQKGQVYIIFPLEKPSRFFQMSTKMWLVQSRSEWILIFL